jgi:hypothetical protein
MHQESRKTSPISAHRIDRFASFGFQLKPRQRHTLGSVNQVLVWASRNGRRFGNGIRYRLGCSPIFLEPSWVRV